LHSEESEGCPATPECRKSTEEILLSHAPWVLGRALLLKHLAFMVVVVIPVTVLVSVVGYCIARSILSDQIHIGLEIVAPERRMQLEAFGERKRRKGEATDIGEEFPREVLPLLRGSV